MGCVLVDECRSGVSQKKFRDDEQSKILFAIEGLLEDMASVAVGSKVHHATTKMTCESMRRFGGLNYQLTACK
jgi:hypothetical protein